MTIVWILIIITNGVCMGMNGMTPKSIEFNSRVSCERAKQEILNNDRGGYCLIVTCSAK